MAARYSTVQWQFVKQSDQWVWRCLLADGTVDNMSALSYRDYAVAVNDAIRHGFSPSRHHWSILTATGITHFEVGRPAVFIPARDVDLPSSGLERQQDMPESKRTEKKSDAEQ